MSAKEKPIMFLTEKKLRKRIWNLAHLRYINRNPIPNIKTKEDETKVQKYPPVVDATWQDFMPKTTWEGRDAYLWMISEFDVPSFKEGEDFVLIFDFGKSGGRQNSGFESFLYIDGVPYQGVDSNHRECFIPYKYSGKKISLALKLWTGLEGGGAPSIQRHFLNFADYATLSKETDNLYHTTEMLYQAMMFTDKNNSNYHTILNMLEHTFEMVDWSYPASDEFYASIKKADTFLTKTLDETHKHSDINVFAIGHTHIDVAWLWTLKHTREKSARSFSTVLRYMERYPDYIFLQSQPQLYKYIKEDYPELYEQMKARIKEGRWEADGGMWLEADCNITSGESLVRQILYGTKFLKEEFDVESKYLWLPDVFGYSWALPQILIKSGLTTFMTTKISWNQYNRMPHDTFKWRGIDGTEILTHFITTPITDGATFYTYNGLIFPETVQGIYNTYQDKDINSDLLLAYGHGDGGGGVMREMLEYIPTINKIPGMPNIQTGRADDYFKKLHETFENTPNYVHTWDGELYLEYHRGTYTTQAFVKKYNRKLELKLREIEMLYSFYDLDNYPTDELANTWEILLRNQFHDIIPGTSINEVYVEARAEYEHATNTLNNLEEKLFASFKKEDNTFTIFNTHAWTVQNKLCFVPTKEEGVFYLKEGNTPLHATKTKEGHLVLIPVINPLSTLVITFSQVTPEKSVSPFTYNQNEVATPFYKIKWNNGGQITSLFDIRNNRQVLKENALGNYFYLHEDKPLDYEAWDIDIFYTLKKNKLDATNIYLIEQNNLFIKIGFDYEFGKSKINQEIILYSHCPRIDFVTEVDWHERAQLLRAYFDVAIRSTTATYDIQYGNVERPTHWNTSWDMAKFETVAHQWIDFSQRDYGVALLNESKYGFNVKDNTMSITLLKSASHPDTTADIGQHSFTYSLLPHTDDFVTGQVIEQAADLNEPLIGRSVLAPEKYHQFDITSDLPVKIDALKKQENGNGIILRLHEHTGTNRTITITPTFKFKSWCETNLLEVPYNNDAYTDAITLSLTPYEIRTILLYLS